MVREDLPHWADSFPYAREPTAQMTSCAASRPRFGEFWWAVSDRGG